MTTPLFDNDYNLDRIADALEGLLAIARAHVTPAPSPADFDGAQYAFDVMMGNPLQAIGNLTAVAVPAAAPAKPAHNPRIHWSKLDPRSRELARLRTAAINRAAAAKTTEQRAAALIERDQAKSEANRRQVMLRKWLAEGKIVIDGDDLHQVAADGTKTKWVPSSYLYLS
jgi:hypothetical protein